MPHIICLLLNKAYQKISRTKIFSYIPYMVRKSLRDLYNFISRLRIFPCVLLSAKIKHHVSTCSLRNSYVFQLVLIGHTLLPQQRNQIQKLCLRGYCRPVGGISGTLSLRKCQVNFSMLIEKHLCPL